ncbi:unnamed protein product [Lathyrus sativus]|nr:unnamed protein product [Lathyrus sativus]
MLLFSSNFVAEKWLGFVTAIWVQAICGNNYTFANYFDVLKSLMFLTQMQLNNLSVVKDVGKAFGIFSGLVSDRWPTSVILIIGAIMDSSVMVFNGLLLAKESPLSLIGW